jgi:hypothetical protein
MKLGAEMNQLETKRTIQRISKIKSWFFEKSNKIDKALGKLTERQKDHTQINKNQKLEGRHNNGHQGNLRNHWVLLQKPVFYKIGNFK